MKLFPAPTVALAMRFACSSFCFSPISIFASALLLFCDSASSAAASSASSVAATNIVNSADDEASEEEESGDDIAARDGDDDDDDDDEGLDFVSALEKEFFIAARDIQNRTSRIVGTAQMEDRRFRELFRACMEIVVHLWVMMDDDDLLPKKSKPKHLLWMLYFLKVYPRQAPGCSAVGGSGGAVNPKTLRKWVWLFIERIGELADDVVSAVDCCVLSSIVYSPPPPAPPARLSSKAG